MTVASASTLDAIRTKLCEIHDLLTLAKDASDSPSPECTALRLARKMTDDLVGTVAALVPTAGDDAWADLKDALANLAATGYDMTSIRVSFATRSLIVYWRTATPTIESFRRPAGEPEVAPEDSLPAGPLTAEGCAAG